MMDTRASGVLLHVSCLPSKYGIGDMGKAAYTLVDQLKASGQKYWQILPLNPSNPTSGESPYFSSSAFSGNPLLIDLDALVEEGLISESDIQIPEGLPPTDVDFTRVREFKLNVLYKAYEGFIAQGENKAFDAFCEQQAWLQDYALFMAIHKKEGKASWADWPVALRDRHEDAITEATQSLAEEIRREKVLQFFFFKQWEKLKSYANEKEIVVFGDMPIYVSYESADVWVDSEFFKLDENKRPVAVSGVPPDYFSATGQLWNNPVYNWDKLKETNYAWWVNRMGALFERFDLVRIDHFRGLVQYWEVPAGEPTAINGTWEDVPTYEFFDTLIKAFPNFPVVVEDLGIITPDVVEVKEHYGFPGMLILQFAFGEDNAENPYLPDNHIENSLVYLGTHDNNTALGWYENEIDDATNDRLRKYIPGADNGPEVINQLVELTLNSKSRIAIVTAQDLLALPGRARINDPSDNFGNWKWRLTQEEFDALPMKKLHELTKKAERC